MKGIVSIILLIGLQNAVAEIAPFSCGTVPFETRSTKSLLSAAAIPSIPGSGEKRLLLYRIDFSDAPGAAIASNTAAQLLVDLNTYYREMSYGLMTIASAQSGSIVTDTLRLPEPSTGYDNDFVKLITHTRQAALDAGYNAALFDSDVIFTGAKPFLVFGALSYVGGPGTWIGNNNFNVGVFGHELGHNLGLPHASFWSTGDQSSIGPGTKEEYGDPFDSMGTPGGNTSHFNTYFKHYVGWISDADAPVVTSNGTYRLNAQDSMASTGLRALRVPRMSGQDYWLEFRNAFNSRAVTNGLGVRWGGTEITNSFLIDTTAGTPGLKNDSPIQIGRTFSDRCFDLHITPVRKAGTIPEALDVVVNRGPFPGNLPPIVTVTASTTNTTAGALVTLTAAAVDANGDALAYWWDMGDGNFGPNAPVFQYAWAANGEYVARCTVSDMKGGAASASVIMRVGTVTTFRVEGTVRGPNGNAVQGALVKAGARFSYSDSDGSYRVSRLTAGRQTLSGVMDGFTLFNSSFDNPLTVGPSASGLDFTALPFSLNAFSFITTGVVWKYLDTGVAPAAAWTQADYGDDSWKTGRAKLGYGVGDEATVVSWGSNANDRYITTWFRKLFAVEDVSEIDHLAVRLRRDDGAVVYLNGTELYRENMPSGTIAPNTPALVDVLPSEEAAYFRRLTTGALHAGTNVIAVEVHQFRTNSTDLSFDLELIGYSESSNALRPSLAAQNAGSVLSLNWPAGFSGWAVQETGDPCANWAPLNAPVSVSNGLFRVFVPSTNSARFYELRKPGFCP